MEAKDLMLGNAITYKSAAGTNERMKVTVSDLYRIEEDSSGYDPIETNEDELIKLGFIESKENSSWMIKDDLTILKDGRSICIGSCFD